MNVREKIEAGEYKSKLVQPDAERRRLSNEIRRLKGNYVPEVLRAGHECALHDLEVQAANILNLIKVYKEDVARLNAIFKADLEFENAMVGHPKADLLFRKAEEHGHSAGLSEIANVYEDLVELAR